MLSRPHILASLLLPVLAGPGLAAADGCHGWYPGWHPGWSWTVGWSVSHGGHRHARWGWGVSVPLVWRRSCPPAPVVVRERVIVSAPAPVAVPAQARASTSIDLTPEAVHGPVVDTWVERRPSVEPILVGGHR
ncbi:MAG: hypothetical protein RLZZ127_2471, partial [Planctomycetota bacterium]